MLVDIYYQCGEIIQGDRALQGESVCRVPADGGALLQGGDQLPGNGALVVKVSVMSWLKEIAVYR
eukprot:10306398-Prorocentrum_lima.AAC.1